MTKKLKEPTATSQVFALLARVDDFMTAPQITVLTGQSRNRVGAALHMLLEYRAVVAVEQGGQLWWAATPATDTRIRHDVDERVPEAKPRKQRKPKAKAK